MDTHLEALTCINLDDMLASFGWEHSRTGRWVAGVFFRGAAQRFARQVIDLDQGIGRLGLQGGAQRIMPQFARELKVQGAGLVPRSGPLLVISNHPGMADTLALFSSLPRPDLRVVGNDRPFLRAMPALVPHMIFVPEQNEGRLSVVREMTGALNSGKAVLTFPAGHIEPDPAVLPGAVESLQDWSESIAIFIRKLPDLQITGAVVSHVLSPQATYHPFTWLRRQKKDRERLGACIQLIANTLFPDFWRLETKVTYTPPLLAKDLAPLHDPRVITHAVAEFMRPYIASAIHSHGRSITKQSGQSQ